MSTKDITVLKIQEAINHLMVGYNNTPQKKREASERIYQMVVESVSAECEDKAMKAMESRIADMEKAVADRPSKKGGKQ